MTDFVFGSKLKMLWQGIWANTNAAPQWMDLKDRALKAKLNTSSRTSMNNYSRRIGLSSHCSRSIVPQKLKEMQWCLPSFLSVSGTRRSTLLGGRKRTNSSNMGDPVRTRKGNLAGTGKHDTRLADCRAPKFPFQFFSATLFLFLSATLRKQRRCRQYTMSRRF